MLVTCQDVIDNTNNTNLVISSSGKKGLFDELAAIASEGLRLARVVEMTGAFLVADEISILVYKSEVFLQSKHLHRSEHGTKAVKHSQYFLRQAVFLQ